MMGKKMDMMPFAEAYERALARVSQINGVEEIAVSAALGRVLAKPVFAPDNVPNHDNTAMDGYAVRFCDLAVNGETTLALTGEVAAGARLDRALQKGEAVRIMTGAPVPEGCDCIVIQEDVTRGDASITFPAGQVQAKWIRRAGQDIAKGARVFGKGHLVTPPDVGMLASLGMAKVQVVRRLRVAILSTGNEVIAPGQALTPGQVYDSNRHSLMAVLQAMGVEIVDLGIIRDSREAIRDALLKGAGQADVVLTSGGVSVGDYDLVKDVITEVGEIDFWKVRMKPGKPQAHGRIGDAVFFGLPGNPVSVLATFLLLVRPAMLVMMGCAPMAQKQMVLPFKGASILKTHGRMEFARGVIEYAGEDTAISSTGSQNSGILTSMSKANGFILLPDEPCEVHEGDMVTVIPIEY